MSTAIATPLPSAVQPAPEAAAIKHVKVSFEQDTRRFSFNAAAADPYAALVGVVRHIYNLPAHVVVGLKYADPDGDAITVSSSLELVEALKVAGKQSLRLQMTVASPAVAPMLRLAPATPAATVATAPMLRLAPATPAASSSEAPRANVAAALKERNTVLRERLAECKQRMHELRMNRKGDIVQVQSLRRQLDVARGEAQPHKWHKTMMAKGRFVADVTLPDGASLAPGAAAVKTWRFRNDHQEAWPEGTRLLFVGGDRMGAPDEVLVQRPVQPGDELDISMPLVAPALPGRYTLFARLAGPAGRRFGQRVWASVVVQDPATASPATSSGEEEAAAASASTSAAAPAVPLCEADAVKYAHQLQLLAEVGFVQLRLNLRLLNKFDGNLERVLERLYARRARADRPDRPCRRHDNNKKAAVAKNNNSNNASA